MERHFFSSALRTMAFVAIDAMVVLLIVQQLYLVR